MIAVDTSALMAIVLREARAAACEEVLAVEPELIISAGTVAEALVVATCRQVVNETERLIDGLGLSVITVTPTMARQVGAAYAKWGKGVHPAGLNFGDCFSYVVATVHDCGLLFVGDDFVRTDVKRVI